MRYKSKPLLLLFASFLAISCNPFKSGLSKSPLPFEYVITSPDGKFILVALGNDDWNCMDDLCDCPMVDAAAYPFGFFHGKLQIDPYYLGDSERRMLGVNDWPAKREAKHSIGLFGYYGANTGIDLALISSFPFETGRFEFEILGFDVQGVIQIKTPDGYAVLGVNEIFETVVAGETQENCKRRNVLTLRNYGFFDDNKVEFSMEFTDYYGSQFGDAQEAFPPGNINNEIKH